jgi:hypothetical protein
VSAFLLTGCATHYTDDAVSDPYGFFYGIWHGAIFLFALFANIISWILSIFGFSFLDSIEIIGRPNTGFWYYFGFVLGLSASAGGSSR